MNDGAIDGANHARLQPASLDLTLAKRAWRVRASFLPSRSRTVTDRLSQELLMHELDIENGAVLERGCVYLVELNESLALPEDVSALANPKSSTGRIDVFVRLVADCATRFDQVPAGYSGKLYAEISPRSFSILVREGSTLNQLRFRRGSVRVGDECLRSVHEKTPLSDRDIDLEDGLGVHVDLRSQGEIIGWRARRHTSVIDVDQPGALAPKAFFEPIYASADDFIILDPDEFYILASREAIAIPPDFAAEMTPINTGLGEFRVHYAGFFDPGFGWADGGVPDSRAVLEVRSHDAPFVLEHGQLVARLVFERMARAPENLYGGALGSNYQGQRLKLSKHFASPDED